MGFNPDDITGGPGPVDPKPGKGFKVADITPPSFGSSANDALMGTSGTDQFSFDEFKFQPKTNADNYLLRAQRQGWGEQLLKTVGNTIANIPLDLVQGLGYTGELLSSDHDYTNGLVDQMEKWKNPFGDVYREHPDKTFDLGDSAWWFNNIGGFVEGAAQFAIPGAGEGALLGDLSKGLSMALKLGKMGEQALLTGSHALTSAHLAYLMAAGSGREVYKNAYSTNYDRFTREGMDPVSADTKAKEMASQGAAAAVRTSTALNTIFGLASIAPMFRVGENSIQNAIEKQAMRQEGETLEQWQSRLSELEKDPAIQQALQYRPSKGLSGHFMNSWQIGAQGVNNEYATKKGMEIGTGKSGKNLDVLSDYFDKVSDSEGALNFLTGLILGPLHTIAIDRIPIHSVIRYDSDGKPLYKQDANITEDADGKRQYQYKLVSAKTRDEMGNQQYFQNAKDAILKDIDWYSKKQQDLQQAVAAKQNLKADQIRSEMFGVHNLNAVMLGVGDSWKNTYQEIERLDNTKDLGEPIAQQMSDIEQKMQQAQTPEEKNALQQQHDDLSAQYKRVSGKTEAMMKGYTVSTEDNDYKQRATEAVSDLDWMKKLHDNLRTNYVSPLNPHSQQLADHIFAREVEQHLNKRILDKEQASLFADEKTMNAFTQYNQAAATSDRVAQGLNADRSNLIEAMQQNNFPELKRLAGKYRIAVHDDADLPGAVKKLTEALKDKIDAHKTVADAATEALHNDTGYTAFKEKNPDKSFEDFLNHIQDEHPIDARFSERKAALTEAQDQWDLRQRALDKVRSEKGIASFMKAAADHEKDFKREIEQKNMKDNIQALQKHLDKQAAANLDTKQKAQMLKVAHDKLRGNIERTNELKAKLEELTKKLDALNSKKGVFKHVDKLKEKAQLRREITSVKAEIDMLTRDRQHDEKLISDLGDKTERAAVQEEQVATAAREDVVHDDTPVDNQEPEPTFEPKKEEPIVAEQPKESDIEKRYISLKDQLPGQVLDTLDNLEAIQDPHNYSYDLARNALYPLVSEQLISEDTAHDLIMMQKEYMEHKAGEQPIKVDTTPESIPTELPDVKVTAEDVSRPSEPITPVINGAPDPDAVQQTEIGLHIGDKPISAMKVNTSSIEYMPVEKPGGKTIDPKTGKPVDVKRHTFLPLYNKLDENANHNILKPGFIQPGDELEFRVDPDFKGEVNYDRMNVTDEYGMPMKRPETFADHTTESGKIIMNSDLDGYANVPIAIYHTKSGEKIGYLPRTDWVTAQYQGARNYRNIEDSPMNEEGQREPGNVEFQRNRLLAVRRRIALAYNEGKGQTIRSTVEDRDSGGHLFYNTDVNRNSEKYKLKPLLAKNLLPDSSLQYGLLNHGSIFVGHGVKLEGPANFTEESLNQRFKDASNIPMVILPMPNDKWQVSPLYTRPLAERPADIHTIARAIEAYLAHGTDQYTPAHEKVIEAIYKATKHSGDVRGLDITQERDLETFINQYFTYTQHFSDVHTRADASVLPGEKKQPHFMLDIPTRFSGQDKSAIKIGTTWSGKNPMYAKIIDGKLDPDFEGALADGLGTHFKNVVYTRGDIRGLNDKRPFHSIIIRKDGTARIDKFDNYNEYLKSFADTIVYGKHKIGEDGKPVDIDEKGTFVYGANPVINFDFGQIDSTRILRTGEQAPAAELETPKPAEAPEDFSDILSEMKNGALNLDSKGEVFNQIGSIEGSKPATIENLNTLHDDTPAEKRNGKSPEEVIREMHSLGIIDIAPNFNPFLKC